MIVAAPLATGVELTWLAGETGLLATAQVRIDDNQGATVMGPVSPDRELGTTGIYVADATMPAAEEQYTIVWSPDGSFDAETNSFEDLLIIAGGATASVPPLVPAELEAGPSAGPCSGWVSAEDVALCCDLATGSDYDLFEDAATAASQLLFPLSGRQFPGSCERTVRPGSDWPCGVQVLARGHIIGWESLPAGALLDRVLLPNHPVTEIIEVKIDGAVLDSDEYRLDGWRWLTRMDDVDGNRQFWPGPQRLTRNDDEDDTFSIRYAFGQNPPQPGIDAAAQLACEIYKSCPGNEAVAANCAIPKNATRVTRQGITVEMSALRFVRGQGWDTGMKLVDAFLNAFNPNGLQRKPLIWSPDGPQFAQEVGTVAGS